MASPSAPAAVDYFLHVLAATEAKTAAVRPASVGVSGGKIRVTVGGARMTFMTAGVAGRIEIAGRRVEFAKRIVPVKQSSPSRRRRR